MRMNGLDPGNISLINHSTHTVDKSYWQKLPQFSTEGRQRDCAKNLETLYHCDSNSVSRVIDQNLRLYFYDFTHLK